MCGGDLQKTNFGLTPWKGEGSLINQAYIKPGQKAKKEAKNAADAARMAEEERQGRISSNVQNINSAFAGREGQYASLGQALRERLNQQLEIQRGNAQRQTKFGLARGGLIGGSAQRDAGKVLNRELAEGALQAERQAQSGVANARQADEATRTSMISLAQSGNDIGNAAAQTASMLNANLASARGNNANQALGDVFGATAQSYRNMTDAAARRRGLTEAQTYAKSFER
jgi:hypothetical protein